MRPVSKRTMHMPAFFYLLLLFASCNTDPGQNMQQDSHALLQMDMQAKKISGIPLPEGYKRVTAPAGSYTAYLRQIPLKADKTVYLYNGAKKSNQEAQYAVIDMDAGTKDLQQCADAVMRIRAEFLYQKKAYNQIRFRFTNGFICDFEHYARGYRLLVRGNSCNWVRRDPENYGYNRFGDYLDVVYAYAGTHSLHQQLKGIPAYAIHPGAVFIQTRNPYGHAVTVMDMAVHQTTHDTIFLLSQSYMPAQDIHILVNPANEKLSPWYSTRQGSLVETPEWTFTWEDLKAF